MSQYIATFFTHFDAMDCSRKLKKLGISVRLAPVPRALSSSCGTCACFECTQHPGEVLRDGYEKVFLVEQDDYTLLLESQE